jgi:hypothetical protein
MTPGFRRQPRQRDAHTLMCIRAVIYRLGAINGTAEMRALSLQLQALAKNKCLRTQSLLRSKSRRDAALKAMLS